MLLWDVVYDWIPPDQAWYAEVSRRLVRRYGTIIWVSYTVAPYSP